jgi:microcompartment protein CcmK/EutM
MRTEMTKDAPTDAAIIGIVDAIEAASGSERRFAIDTR